MGKVSRSQGLKVSKSQGLKVSRSQGLKVSGCQGLKVSGSQGQGVGLRVPRGSRWSRESGCLDGQGGPGNPGGPGSPGGPGGQGCLGGQSGPGDQVCRCTWFAWSKQSNYRENLRCHGCDTLTDAHGKVVQYPVCVSQP